MKTNSTVLDDLIECGKRNAKVKDPHGHRWTPAEKMRFLGYFRRGPKLYKKLLLDLRPSLPTVRTLLRLLSQLNFDVGIMDHVMEAAQDELKKLNIKDKICKINYDEMSLKVRYHYNRQRDKIIGFGDYGNELPNRNETGAPGRKALVFMLEGLNKAWKIPICFFSTDGSLTGPDMQILISKVINAANKHGFDVRATVSDQAKINVAAANFFRQRFAGDKQFRTHFTVIHPGTEQEHKVYILYDVPHMLKCIRNNWLGPFGTWIKNNLEKDRSLYPGNILSVDGTEGHWKYILLLYSYLFDNGTIKSFEKYIFPTSRDKMRV